LPLPGFSGVIRARADHGSGPLTPEQERTDGQPPQPLERENPPRGTSRDQGPDPEDPSTAQHRRDLAALKRQVAALARTVAFLEKQGRVASPPVPQEVKGVRFSARSVKAQRARLGLSAKDFGRLVGVSALTIYSWESGKSRPRKKQLPGLAAVRGLGKREARQRLEMMGGKK